MMIKIHSRGRGSGAGPIDYLLGKHRDREGARVLRNDPDETEQLINTSQYAQRYTSGVLSFAEADLPEDKKTRLMSGFEAALLPGLDKDQYQCLWVEHLDKGRLELNFVVPNIELTSGKRLQPYYDRADRPRLNAWKQIANIAYGLHDPDDPINRRDLVAVTDLPSDKQQAKTLITAGLSRLVEAGEIRHREDIIKTLENNGFTVVRQTKRSISIADPDGGRNLRLQGVMYEQAFRPGDHLRSELESASRRYRADAEARFREARATYQRCTARKSAENKQRHPRPQPAHAASHHEKRIVADSEHTHRDHFDVGHTVVAGDRNRPEMAGNRLTERTARSASETGRETDLPKMRGAVVPGDSERQWQLGEKKRSTPAVHPRRLLTPNITNDNKEARHDRTRKHLARRLRAALKRAREASQRLAERTSELAAHVRDYFARQRTFADASRTLEHASHELERTIPPIERVVQQEQALAKKRQRQQERGHGLSR